MAPFLYESQQILLVKHSEKLFLDMHANESGGQYKLIYLICQYQYYFINKPRAGYRL
jgi:hypothetical protein